MTASASIAATPRPEGLPAARRATRLVFLLVGIAMASWAPMVPYAKARLDLPDSVLGLLLLGIGVGALLAMPLAGWALARFGCRRVIPFAALLACIDLPLLAFADRASLLGIALLVFGAAIGVTDVAMNTHAVLVQNRERRALMSGFHALFSAGGIAGALGIAALLRIGMALGVAALLVAVLCVALLVSSWDGLLREEIARRAGPRRLRVNRIVLLIGALCFIAFLAEGAVLDWSAVFLHFDRNLAQSAAGLGYAAFSAAMVVGRLTGDATIRRLGPTRVVGGSALLAACGLLLAIACPGAIAAIAGFTLVGLGAANIVPTLFNAAAQIEGVPAHAALPVVNGLGYLGLLAGPALIGAASLAAGLPAALGIVVLGLLVIAAARNLAIRRKA